MDECIDIKTQIKVQVNIRNLVENTISELNFASNDFSHILIRVKSAE